jgi:hypothetical protein
VLFRSGETAALDRFGFRGGARYEVNLTDLNSSWVFASLCTSSEFRRLRRIRSPCSVDSFYHPQLAQVLPVVDRSAVFTGVVESRVVLQPVFSACGSRGARFNVSLVFDNQNSLLDSRVLPYLILEPFSLAVFAFLGAVWFGNWIVNRRPKNPLHDHFEATVTTTVLFILFDYCQLSHFSHSDAPTLLVFPRALFQMIQHIALLSMSLMIANGASLIRLDTPACDRFRCLMISSAVVVPAALVDLCGNPRGSIRVECVSTFIGLRLFYILKFFQRLNTALGAFLWDTKVIAENEITLKARALQRFRACSGRLFAYVIALMVLWSADNVQLFVFWWSRFLQDAIWFMALSELALVSRVQCTALVYEAEIRNEVDRKSVV